MYYVIAVDQPDREFVEEDDTVTVYWNEKDGFGSLESATVFTAEEARAVRLPSLELDPKWVSLPAIPTSMRVKASARGLFSAVGELAMAIQPYGPHSEQRQHIAKAIHTLVDHIIEVGEARREAADQNTATGCKPEIEHTSSAGAVMQIVSDEINRAYERIAASRREFVADDVLDTLRPSIANRLAAAGLCTYDEFSDACRKIRD